MAQAARQAARIGSEELLGGLSVQELGVEQRLQHGRDHHLVVGIESAHDVRDIQGGEQDALAGLGQIEGASRGEGGVQPLARRAPG